MKDALQTSRIERFSYAGFFVGQNLIYIFVLSFLSIFLTDEVGIGTSAVATLLLVARVWDAINDPILGSLVDRVQPRNGKFKPWVSSAIILLPISTILLFWKFEGSGTINLTYAYLTYLIWGMIYTVSDVPIFALATSMTSNLNERTSLIAWGRLAAGVAAMIGGIIGAPLLANFGYQTTIVALMGIAFLLMMPLHFFVRERVIHTNTEPVTLKQVIHAVVRNKYLLVFQATGVIVMASNLGMNVGPYFAKWNLGNFEIQAVIMATSALPMLLVPGFLPMLIRRFGKRRIVIVAFSGGLVVGVLQYLAGYENFGLFLALNALKSVGFFLPLLMAGMFSADCAEYGAYVTGKRNEGVTFSIQTFGTKLSSALAGTISVLLLGFYGYDGQAATQSAEALQGIWYQMTLFPLFGLAIGLFVFARFYKLSEKDVADIVREMKENPAYN